MKVVAVSELPPDRVVDCPKGGFRSHRILLASDGMGFTLTKTVIPPRGPQRWHYKHHREACYCVSGRGELTELSTGTKHAIVPGTAYVLDGHEAHEFEAFEECVLVCVFNPPLSGREVHREDGSYEPPKE